MHDITLMRRWNEVRDWTDENIIVRSSRKTASGQISRFWDDHQFRGRDWSDGIEDRSILRDRLKHGKPEIAAKVDETIKEIANLIAPPMQFRKRGSHRRSMAGEAVNAMAYGSFARDPRPVDSRDPRIFTPTRRKPRVAKIVKISFDAGVDYGTRQKDTIERVAMVAALSEVLESKGVGTEIHTITVVGNPYEDYPIATCLDVAVKSPGDPMSRPALLASLCDIGVWRYSLLPMSIGAVVDHHGKYRSGKRSMNPGLGHPGVAPMKNRGDIHIGSSLRHRSELVALAKKEIERYTGWMEKQK